MAATARTGRGTTGGLPAAIRDAATSGLVLGIGAMGAADTIVFHQLLQWHNFVVHAGLAWRIASDGLLHLFTAGTLLLGALRVWRLRRRLAGVTTSRPLAAGVLVGLGSFQLLDGIVVHKILRLHPIREGVENALPYDLGWNALALALLLAGWRLWPRAGEGTGAGEEARRAA